MVPWLTGLKQPLRVALGAAILVALGSLLIPNYYRSEAKLLPLDNKVSGIGAAATAAAVLGLGGGSDGAEANYVDILKSRRFRESLLNSSYDYRIKSWRFGEVRRVKGSLLEYSHAKNMERGAAVAGSILTASRDLKTRVITISAETMSPELSQQVVHRAIAILESFIQEKGRTRGSNKAAFAEQRLKEAEAEQTKAEIEFRDFLNSNRNYLASSEPTVRLRGLRLEGALKLRQQLAFTLAMSREQALMEEKNDMPVLNVLDEGALPIGKSRPDRAFMCESVFIVFFLAVWAWLNQAKVKVFFNEK